MAKWNTSSTIMFCLRARSDTKETHSDVSTLCFSVCHCLGFGFQKYKMNFDKNTGVIEMIMESLTPADEGTFTFQLQDGKATNQSSLVLIGDGMFL